MELVSAKIRVKTAIGSILDYKVSNYEEFQRVFEAIRDLNRRENANHWSSDLDFDKVSK